MTLPCMVPEPDDAVQQFEMHGGHLTLFSAFGRDPLEDREDLIKARKEDFCRKYPEFGCFFYMVVNNDYSLFHEGLVLY